MNFISIMTGLWRLVSVLTRPPTSRRNRGASISVLYEYVDARLIPSSSCPCLEAENCEKLGARVGADCVEFKDLELLWAGDDEEQSQSVVCKDQRGLA